MTNLITGLLISFSYFSYIPISIKEYKSSDTITKYMLFFIPLVGLSLGLISVVSYYIFSYFFVPIYSAILVSVVYFILYGFLHLEAICDVVDGYFASFSNKDIHSIMKSPTVGAMGIIAIVLFLILKVSTIIYLAYQSKIFLLVIAFTLSRLSVHFVLYTFSFHISSKMANNLKANLNTKLFIFTIIFYLVLLSYILSSTIVIFLAMILLCYMIVRILHTRLGFINGDVLGFCIELCELFVLIALLMI